MVSLGDCPVAFSLDLISFPKKVSDFFVYQLLGCPVQEKMGDGFSLHFIKKKISSSCFFVFFFLVTQY